MTALRAVTSWSRATCPGEAGVWTAGALGAAVGRLAMGRVTTLAFPGSAGPDSPGAAASAAGAMPLVSRLLATWTRAPASRAWGGRFLKRATSHPWTPAEAAAMDLGDYDEFGNYIGPALEEEEEDDGEQREQVSAAPHLCSRPASPLPPTPPGATALVCHAWTNNGQGGSTRCGSAGAKGATLGGGGDAACQELSRQLLDTHLAAPPQDDAWMDEAEARARVRGGQPALCRPQRCGRAAAALRCHCGAPGCPVLTPACSACPGGW